MNDTPTHDSGQVSETIGQIIGKVASPPGKEATSEEFHFWISDDVLVEKGQIVHTAIQHQDETISFYGVVQEVYRQSRFRTLAEEYDRYDGQTDYAPPYEIPGVNFAEVSILRTTPDRLCPPRDGTDVMLGGADEARIAWRADEISSALNVGLIRNGGSQLAGPGTIDLDYLLGANGGHLNVNGVAGRATKSAFLLHMIYLLLNESRRQRETRVPNSQRLKVVPIILNVKNFDLFHIDKPGKKFDPGRDGDEWRQLGIESPQPFRNVQWFAPAEKGTTNPVHTGRLEGDVAAYSYSLADVIERGLFPYLFSEQSRQNDNFTQLVLELENYLTREKHTGERLEFELREGDIRTFDDLLEQLGEWADDDSQRPFRVLSQTLRMFHRRLSLLLLEGRGVLRRSEQHGCPLDVTRTDTCAPIVIDLSALAQQPLLQKFVVGAIFQQLKRSRTGADVTPGLVYLVMIDELNRFAPKNSSDPVTKLMEHVAAEMRSQGIIMLGGQQQASLVSGRVIENAGVRAVGKSGSLELSNSLWKFLSVASRGKAAQLLPEEKLIVQDSFREPMLLKIPRPPWAMRFEEVAAAPIDPSEELDLDSP